jgi:hypothetical protein
LATLFNGVDDRVRPVRGMRKPASGMARRATVAASVYR